MNATAEPASLRLPSLGIPAGTAADGQHPSPKKPLSRNAVIAIAVVVLHVAFLWALQSGLLMRAAELVVQTEILTQFIEPLTPKVEPLTPPVPKPQVLPTPVKKTVAKTVMQPAPQPLAIADPTPSPNAPVGITTPQTALAPITAPVAVAANTAAAPAAGTAVQLPSSDADYLQNPRPPYPPISRRLNEQGKTTVRVLIGVDGLPQRSEIVKSSGFERLDQAAMATVMRWRYVPGKRGGVPEAMWFNVPINWVLE